MFASETWSGTANGTYISFATTPSGTLLTAEALRIENSGGMTVPASVAGGDKGAGSINASSFFIGGVAFTLPISLANGGTGQALVASNGGIVWSDATKLNILAGTATPGLCLLSGALSAPAWASCAGAGSGVTSLGNASADTSLTIAGTGSGPWTGIVTAKINLGNNQTWTGTQTFSPNTLKLLGSSTGVTTINSANAGASNFTLVLPAVSDTVAVLGTNQTHTAVQTFSGTLNASGTFQIGGVTVALPISLANGGTNNASLTASNGGVVWSDATKLNVLAGTVTAGQCLLSGSSAAPTWGSCSGAATVASVGNAVTDTSLTIAGTGTGPWTGAVTVKLNLGNAQTWTGIQTFTNSTIKLLGSSTGATTFTSANASASNFTLTVPAVTDTLAVLGANQTFTGTVNFSGSLQIGGAALTLPVTLANGGTNNAALTASAGGIVWSDASKLNVLAGTVTGGQCLLSGSSASPTWGSCAGAAVSSVGNAVADTSITITGTGAGPWTGSVLVKINLANAQTWTAAQTFSTSAIKSARFVDRRNDLHLGQR